MGRDMRQRSTRLGIKPATPLRHQDQLPSRHPPIQPFLLSAKQGGIFRVFDMTPLGNRMPDLPVSGRTFYHKATELVTVDFIKS